MTTTLGNTLRALPERWRITPRVFHGALSGLLGATIVAVLFLVLDWIAGRPFWTPHLLGSALYLGASPADAISPALVFGYSLAHGAVFIPSGLLAANLLPLLPWRHPGLRGLATSVALFVAFEFAVFALFRGMLVESGLAQPDAMWVTIANLLAGCAMGTYLAMADAFEVEPAGS